jgi:hypothetical protein
MRIAPMASSAVFGLHDDEMLIFVEAEYICRAEFDAQPASFAPLPKNDDTTSWSPARFRRPRILRFRWYCIDHTVLSNLLFNGKSPEIIQVIFLTDSPKISL